MAAFDHDRLRSQFQDGAGRGHAVVPSPDRSAGQRFGFRNVWRDEVRQGQQSPAEGLDRVFTEQAVAALGDHHRVDDQGAEPMPLDAGGHDFDDGRAREHSGLECGNRKIFGNGVELRGDDAGIDLLDGPDADGILGGDRGDDRHAVDAKRGERFQIGLDAGTGPGV